jgi:hypothetical protein
MKEHESNYLYQNHMLFRQPSPAQLTELPANRGMLVPGQAGHWHAQRDH